MGRKWTLPTSSAPFSRSPSPSASSAWRPDAIARLSAPKKDRRLKVVESLVLDPARRLIIVECDGRERLVLLGEGRMLGDLDKKDIVRRLGVTLEPQL